MEKSRAKQSHTRNNIVPEGVGVRVRCKNEEVERTMILHPFFVSIPRPLATIVFTFSGRHYCFKHRYLNMEVCKISDVVSK